MHAMASAHPWNCKLPSEAWVGALGLAENDVAMDSAKAAVSKTMRRLEQRKLITRRRSKRLSDITLQKEDGSGDDYKHPIESGEPYFQLPYAYWHEGHYTSLHLPAKVMLLIALSLQAGFNLPYDRARDWYGVSQDSAEKGLRELRRRNLLSVEPTWIPAPRSATGWTERLEYTLQGSFSRAKRRKAELVTSGESYEVPAE